MNIDSLEKEGYIKKLSVDKRKVKDALHIAKRDIKTAKSMLQQDMDWAFSIAYNAMLQTLRALMFSKGYRPSGSNQHISVVKFAELFLDRETVIIFDRMRRKRHITIYDIAGTISERDAEHAVATAEILLKKVEKIVQE